MGEETVATESAIIEAESVSRIVFIRWLQPGGNLHGRIS